MESEKDNQKTKKKTVRKYRPASPEDRLRAEAVRQHYRAETYGAKRRAELGHRNYI